MIQDFGNTFREGVRKIDLINEVSECEGSTLSKSTYCNF